MRWFGPRYPERRRVVVNTTNDESFRGVLWETTGEYLLLKSAELLREHAEPVSVDGEVLIYRPQVLWLQVLYE